MSNSAIQNQNKKRETKNKQANYTHTKLKQKPARTAFLVKFYVHNNEQL